MLLDWIKNATGAQQICVPVALTPVELVSPG